MATSTEALLIPSCSRPSGIWPLADRDLENGAEKLLNEVVLASDAVAKTYAGKVAMLDCVGLTCTSSSKELLGAEAGLRES